jgi:hypothetical protein
MSGLYSAYAAISRAPDDSVKLLNRVQSRKQILVLSYTVLYDLGHYNVKPIASRISPHLLSIDYFRLFFNNSRELHIVKVVLNNNFSFSVVLQTVVVRCSFAICSASDVALFYIYVCPPVAFESMR